MFQVIMFYSFFSSFVGGSGKIMPGSDYLEGTGNSGLPCWRCVCVL